MLGTSPDVDRPGRGPRAVQRAVRRGSGSRSRRAAPRPTRRRGAGDRRPGSAIPVLVRPSYVLGGRAMQIVYDDDDLRRAMAELAADRLARARGRPLGRAARAHRPLPRGRDRGRRRRDPRPHRRGAHRRRHGAHRGGRACTRATPRARSRRRRCRPTVVATIEAVHARARRRARRRRPAQRAVRGEGRQVFVIEANPRASRTVPFVSKATGVPLAKVAARVMVGATLAELRERGAAAPAGRRRSRRR